MYSFISPIQQYSYFLKRGQYIIIIIYFTHTVVVTKLVIALSLPGKFALLNDLSIRSFDCMVCRSFHTPSRYDFRSNVIRPLVCI